MGTFLPGSYHEQFRYFTSHTWASMVLLGDGLNSADTRKLTGNGVAKQQPARQPNLVSNIQPQWNCLTIVNWKL